MKKQMIGDVPGSVLGMLSDLTSKLQHGAITPEQLEGFLKGKNPFEKAGDLIAEWQDFWKRHGVETDFTGLVIPVKKKGFDRLLVIPQGLTLNWLVESCPKKFFISISVQDLRNVNIKNKRTTKKAYAIWVRDRAEADEELKNISFNDLKEKNIFGITLLERIVYEFKYFDETSKHLDDIQSITLCSGSCDDNNIPGVLCNNNSICVVWYYSDYARGFLRSRAVVA